MCALADELLPEAEMYSLFSVTPKSFKMGNLAEAQYLKQKILLSISIC